MAEERVCVSARGHSDALAPAHVTFLHLSAGSHLQCYAALWWQLLESSLYDQKLWGQAARRHEYLKNPETKDPVSKQTVDTQTPVQDYQLKRQRGWSSETIFITKQKLTHNSSTAQQQMDGIRGQTSDTRQQDPVKHTQVQEVSSVSVVCVLHSFWE